MNSYGDSSSARGRAQPPGSRAAFGRDADDPNQGSRGGRSAAGRAQPGRASVPVPGSGGSGTGYDPRPAGRASIGVGGAAGAAPASGRAGVGRASVRPVSPGGPRVGGPGGPGGRGPGGPGGPGGPRHGGRGGKDSPEAQRRAKRRKRTNLLISGFAVLIMLLGLGLVGFTWYYDKVPAPTDFSEPETTTILYTNGSELAKLGKQNRTLVPYQKISPVVKQAVMAAEDKNFLEHGGIDVMGIARAAWNNFTGGDRQGASTITQQYARHAGDLTGMTYARKLREAVLASKIEQEWDKQKILGAYLNAIYLGRGAYGIEAGAKTYFGKSVLTPPGKKGALTKEEAAVLASLIKQPEPDPATGHKGYDPQINPQAAHDRWNYTLNNMVEKGWMTQAERDAAKYPKVKKYDAKKSCTTNCGINKPTGNVVNYVASELEAMGITDWKKGGYRITTSIDPRVQKAAENAAQQSNKHSPMHKLSKKLMAALVAVDPSNGRVLAYYGGDTGTGHDYAGRNSEGGKITGGHPPGSSFKIYTLAAALKEGVSLDSHWDSEKYKDGDLPVLTNADRKASCRHWCSLEEMTIQSYNVPFYWLTKGMGAEKVVAAARDAGIRTLWTDKLEAVDLTKVDPKDVAPSKFGPRVGFGQYGITVLDHANGTATIANRGVYNKAHFIVKVEHKNLTTGKYDLIKHEKLKPKQVFEPAQMDDLTAVLQKIPRADHKELAGGRHAIAKTGTWQWGNTDHNAHAWIVGATPQIASAVWVGNKGAEGPIKGKWGNDLGGATAAGPVWKQFMDDAHEALKLPEKDFPDRKNTGDPNTPLANGISPPPKPTKKPEKPGKQCPIPLFCQNDGGNGGGGRNGGGGGGGQVLVTPTPTETTRQQR